MFIQQKKSASLIKPFREKEYSQTIARKENLTKNNEEGTFLLKVVDSDVHVHSA